MEPTNGTNQPPVTDEAMMTISDMVGEFTEPIGELVDKEEGVGMFIEGIEMDMPVQLDVVTDEEGKVQIGITPPLYKVDTSFSTVYHQIRFSFEKID